MLTPTYQKDFTVTMDVEQLRSIFAYLALGTFVVATAVGGFLWEPWAGFVALGLTSGLAALFLGADG